MTDDQRPSGRQHSTVDAHEDDDRIFSCMRFGQLSCFSFFVPGFRLTRTICLSHSLTSVTSDARFALHYLVASSLCFVIPYASHRHRPAARQSPCLFNLDPGNARCCSHPRATYHTRNSVSAPYHMPRHIPLSFASPSRSSSSDALPTPHSNKHDVPHRLSSPLLHRRC